MARSYSSFLGCRMNLLCIAPCSVPVSVDAFSPRQSSLRASRGGFADACSATGSTEAICTNGGELCGNGGLMCRARSAIPRSETSAIEAIVASLWAFQVKMIAFLAQT